MPVNLFTFATVSVHYCSVVVLRNKMFTSYVMLEFLYFLYCRIVLILKFLHYIRLYLTGADGIGADQVTVAKSSAGRRKPPAKVTRKKAVKYIVEVHFLFLYFQS